MKKKNYLFISVIIALTLSACGKATAPSSVISSNNTVSSLNETKSSSNKESSKESSSSKNVSSSDAPSSVISSSSEASSSKQSSSSEESSSSEQSSSSIISSSEVSSSSEASSSEQSSSSELSSSEISSSSELSSSIEASSSSEMSSSSEASSSSSEQSSSEEVERIVDLEIFAFNDTHGNVTDTSAGLGIGKTTSLLKTYPSNINNALFISQGDMWQGTAESNNTRGKLVTEWMNQVGFTSMTVGNHEFDWGTSYIESNSQLANFPFLGINVYSRVTNERLSYLDPSVVVEKNGAKIGIIGAIGDCYNSISSSFVQDVYFKVGSDLTNLVKQESVRLRNEEHCDMIIYSIHDGSSSYTSLTTSHYDESLSNGYVDLVLEGHTHKNYILTDSYGVYHLQCYSDNKAINYVNLTINTKTDNIVFNTTRSIYTNNYDYLTPDTTAESLFTKYADEIGDVDSVIGYNSRERSADEIGQLVVDLYLKYGLEEWDSSYNIYLASSRIQTRSPYTLHAGDITYADLTEIIPFDNPLLLCSISGYDLKYKFVSPSSPRDYYFYTFSDYGRNNSYITYADTYYIVADSYTKDYSYNNLTTVATFHNDKYFARDMLRDYIAAGNLA